MCLFVLAIIEFDIVNLIPFIHCHAEREQYKISIEVYPAQESYDIGTQVTLRCILPPSLQNFPFITIDWKTTVPNVLPYYHPLRYELDTSNVSFVVPSHHPMSANYYCSVRGVESTQTELVRERITLKIKCKTIIMLRLVIFIII